MTKWLMFNTTLALFTILWPRIFSQSQPTRAGSCDTAYPTEDILCNNSTGEFRKYACVCLVSDYSLENYTSCDSLVNTDSLPALRLTLTSSNGFRILDSLSRQTVVLNGVQVPYEYYFKRRVANIISTYCLDANHHCKSLIEGLGPENVVILRLSCHQNNILLDYIVLKSPSARNLTEDNAIEPGLILDALKPKLQKTLPYKIVEHSVYTAASSDESDSNEDRWNAILRHNTGLIIGLIVIAGLLLLVFTMAILKAIRDRWKHRRRPPALSTKETHPSTTDKSTHYGATGEHLLVDIPNQKKCLATPEKDDEIFFTTMPDDETVDELAGGSFIKTDSAIDRKISSPSVASVILIQPKPPAIKLKVSTSLQFNILPKHRGHLRKCLTLQHLRDGTTRRTLLRSPTEYKTPPPTPASIISNRKGKKSTSIENAWKVNWGEPFEKDNTETQTMVQVPILIVPAMKNHQHLGEYVKLENGDENGHFQEYWEKGGYGPASDDEQSRVHRRSGSDQYKTTPTMRSATSEDQLIPRNQSGEALQSKRDQRVSSVSSDTANSDTEANGQTVGFRLLTSGIGYRPLTESNCSVNKIRDRGNYIDEDDAG